MQPTGAKGVLHIISIVLLGALVAGALLAGRSMKHEKERTAAVHEFLSPVVALKIGLEEGIDYAEFLKKRQAVAAAYELNKGELGNAAVPMAKLWDDEERCQLIWKVKNTGSDRLFPMQDEKLDPLILRAMMALNPSVMNEVKTKWPADEVRYSAVHFPPDKYLKLAMGAIDEDCDEIIAAVK